MRQNTLSSNPLLFINIRGSKFCWTQQPKQFLNKQMCVIIVTKAAIPSILMVKQKRKKCRLFGFVSVYVFWIGYTPIASDSMVYNKTPAMNRMQECRTAFGMALRGQPGQTVGQLQYINHLATIFFFFYFFLHTGDTE